MGDVIREIIISMWMQYTDAFFTCIPRIMNCYTHSSGPVLASYPNILTKPGLLHKAKYVWYRCAWMNGLKA